MYHRIAMRRRVIIGVVGGSTNISTTVKARAREIGAAIAATEAVLLTGGTGGVDSVKDAAADGANGGRIISIVKRGRGVERNNLHIVIHSGMRDARNVLNAYAADVLLALCGGAGTLSEVAFATIARRPVAFVDGSRAHLRGYLTGMADIAEQAVATFGNTGFSEANLQRVVAPILDDVSNDATSVLDAVQRALLAPRVGMLPNIPEQPDAVRKYVAALEHLDA